MRSILDSASKDVSLRFHLATHDVPDADRAVLEEVVEGSPRDATIRFVYFDSDRVRHLQRSRLITHTAYARLFVGEFLPLEAERVVYVDCDLMFERDIGELWAADLLGNTLGAVDNRYWEDSSRHQQRLGLAEPEYFNSGVLVVDMERWRSLEMRTRALDFAEQVGERLILHDQDALNGALQGDWRHLPLHWNAWTIHPELHEDSEAVFHFMGAPKPWHADYSGRFADKFYGYLDRTPYAGLRPWDPLGLGRLYRKVKRRIPFLPSAARMLRSRLSGAGVSER